MISNLSKNFQFSTWLTIETSNIETVNEAKLLGVQITSNLKWSRNTEIIIKKANARMQLLRKVSNFGASESDLKQIYITFIRSLLEQSCVVWHSGLSNELSNNLERIQKCAIRLILKRSYKNYTRELQKLSLNTLKERWQKVSLDFAKNCIKHPKM